MKPRVNAVMGQGLSMVESLRKCATCGHTRDRHPGAKECSEEVRSLPRAWTSRLHCPCKQFAPGEGHEEAAPVLARATLIEPGDPSVGICGHQVDVENLNLDLNLFVEEDQQEVLDDLRRVLQELGKLATGDRCDVLIFDRKGDLV